MAKRFIAILVSIFIFGGIPQVYAGGKWKELDFNDKFNKQTVDNSGLITTKRNVKNNYNEQGIKLKQKVKEVQCRDVKIKTDNSLGNISRVDATVKNRVSTGHLSFVDALRQKVAENKYKEVKTGKYSGGVVGATKYKEVKIKTNNQMGNIDKIDTGSKKSWLKQY